MPQPLQKLREYARKHDESLRQGAPVLGVLAVLVLVIVGIWVVWKVPEWQVQHSLDTALRADSAKQLELEDNFRKTIVQSLGGAIVLLGLYYSARTFGLSRQGHITDRFTKAIEQLGKLNGDHPSIEVRLGAIYALERIAIDSPRDHWTIMEILTAYVRLNAPLDPGHRYSESEEPRTDIQAILTVLGRRKTGPTRERPERRLDLSASRLCGADLYETNLQLANLQGANLQGATLSDANLRGAYMPQANLRGAHMPQANLQDAHLTEANLQGAHMPQANLQGANLNQANLQGAYMPQANLQGANLNQANLQDASLDEANLQDASPQYANLQGANLAKANLRGAILYRTNLQNADVTDANLQGAILADAILLKTKGLTPAQVTSTKDWETAHYSPALRKALGHPPKETVESEHPPAPDSDEPTDNN